MLYAGVDQDFAPGVADEPAHVWMQSQPARFLVENILHAPFGVVRLGFTLLGFADPLLDGFDSTAVAANKTRQVLEKSGENLRIGLEFLQNTSDH